MNHINIMNTVVEQNIVISRQTQHRLIKDVRDLITQPLTNDGIYYIHDEDNML